MLGAISPDAIGLILSTYLAPFRVRRAAVVSELLAKAGVSTTYALFNYVLDRIAYLEVLFTLHNYNSDQEQMLQMFLIRQSYFAGRKFAGTAAPPLQHFRATSCSSTLPMFLFANRFGSPCRYVTYPSLARRPSKFRADLVSSRARSESVCERRPSVPSQAPCQPVQ